MKEEIHPKWYAEARVTCACGNTWVTGSTSPEIRTDVCSNCHPFYTGEQRIVDTEGQVDRFMKRLQARDEIRTQVEEMQVTSSPLNKAISELELGPRYDKAFEEAGIVTIGDFMSILETGGDQAIISIKGIGAKTLIDAKRAIRSYGIRVPENA